MGQSRLWRHVEEDREQSKRKKLYTGVDGPVMNTARQHRWKLKRRNGYVNCSNVIYYVYRGTKVGEQERLAAHRGEKVDGPRPTQPNSFRRLWWHWRNFVPYLCQLIFVAILYIKTLRNVCHCVPLTYALLVSHWSYKHFLKLTDSILFE